ncbi:retrovirus-related pol polyprotein from transposon TNT 1-94 [Tanacetum coccineum]|uniref:Retrovirus-related pol polyprotein from transposon TNT 1-94 n=1 Tax=Tanacetum coccineum TaxID=301880 RepID=A0ABQ5FF19_9ASTR
MVILWYLTQDDSKDMMGNRSQSSQRTLWEKFIWVSSDSRMNLLSELSWGYGDYVIGDSVTLQSILCRRDLEQSIFCRQFVILFLKLPSESILALLVILNGADFLKVVIAQFVTRFRLRYDKSFSRICLLSKLQIWLRSTRLKFEKAINFLFAQPANCEKDKKFFHYTKILKTTKMECFIPFLHGSGGHMHGLNNTVLMAYRQTPQQNGVVERRNRTLVEAARTMLIFSKAPMFLWEEAVATACYTQNRFLIHTRHNKTPYELDHDKKPDLTFLRVFGALCYPTNDSEDLDYQISHIPHKHI